MVSSHGGYKLHNNQKDLCTGTTDMILYFQFVILVVHVLSGVVGALRIFVL